MENKKIVWISVIVLILAVAYYMFRISNRVVEPVSSEQKIDVGIVCEGALAYMSFPDGESAEKFVAECKAGEHPEVIEKYKADMNLGAGATI